MTTDGRVKVAGFRKMNVERQWNVDSWGALGGLLWDVTETGADAAEAVQAPRPHSSCPSSFGAISAPFLTVGCAAYSDIAVHGKTAKPHTDERRTRIGEAWSTNGRERLQRHRRRRDVGPERGEARAPVLAQIAMPSAVSGESMSVKRGAVAGAEDEELAHMRSKSEKQSRPETRHGRHCGTQGQDQSQAGIEGWVGQKRGSTQLLSDLAEEVSIYHSTTVSMSVEDMV